MDHITVGRAAGGREVDIVIEHSRGLGLIRAVCSWLRQRQHPWPAGLRRSRSTAWSHRVELDCVVLRVTRTL